MSLKTDLKYYPTLKNYTVQYESKQGRRGVGVPTIIHDSIPIVKVEKEKYVGTGMAIIHTRIQLP